MKIKGVQDSFTDYKKNSIFIAVSSCDFKCEKENLCPKGCCQNSELIKSENIEVSNHEIIDYFNNNIIAESIIFGALEPMLQFDEIYEFIKEFRKTNNNDVIIYTGYYLEELECEVDKLKEFDNIIVKFGRYISNSKPKYDHILGVTLASENQYAKIII